MDVLKELVKFRLTLFVVISSIVGYLMALKGPLEVMQLVFLACGGFLITGAANTLNQILEREYDALMTRTASRPLPTGRKMCIRDRCRAAGRACRAPGVPC